MGRRALAAPTRISNLGRTPTQRCLRLDKACAVIAQGALSPTNLFQHSNLFNSSADYKHQTPPMPCLLFYWNTGSNNNLMLVFCLNLQN